MTGYLEKNEHMLKYLNIFKEKLGIHNQIQRKRTLKNMSEAKEVKNLFALDDEEVENIFDILESEHPELWNVINYARSMM